MVSSLIQFISNLVYGKGKLKQMLAKENTSEFLGTLKDVLDQIKIEPLTEDELNELEKDDDKKNMEEIMAMATK